MHEHWRILNYALIALRGLPASADDDLRAGIINCGGCEDEGFAVMYFHVCAESRGLERSPSAWSSGGSLTEDHADPFECLISASNHEPETLTFTIDDSGADAADIVTEIDAGPTYAPHPGPGRRMSPEAALRTQKSHPIQARRTSPTQGRNKLCRVLDTWVKAVVQKHGRLVHRLA